MVVRCKLLLVFVGMLNTLKLAKPLWDPNSALQCSQFHSWYFDQRLPLWLYRGVCKIKIVTATDLGVRTFCWCLIWESTFATGEVTCNLGWGSKPLAAPCHNPDRYSISIPHYALLADVSPRPCLRCSSLHGLDNSECPHPLRENYRVRLCYYSEGLNS